MGHPALAVDLDGTVQQLILSAIVEYLKDAPLVKALNIKTGYAPYARAPTDPNYLEPINP